MLRWNGVIDMNEEHIQNQIKTMADKAISNKAVLWHKIQEIDPPLACTLKCHAQFFGKPDYMIVKTLDNEIIGKVRNV